MFLSFNLESISHKFLWSSLLFSGYSIGITQTDFMFYLYLLKETASDVNFSDVKMFLWGLSIRDIMYYFLNIQ